MAYIKTGSSPWLPNFSIAVEGEDITDTVRQNLADLTLKDHGAGSKKSDEVTFSVVSQNMQLPAKGVKLTVSLGFGGTLVGKGTFVVDARKSSGGGGKARVLQITARAVSKSNEGGHSTLQSQKTRSFDAGITLGDLVGAVAAEHGLIPAVDASLASVPLEHIDQLAESDMNMLTRMAERYGGVSKITHDHWVVTPRDSTTNVNGKPLPVRTITPDMCSGWSYHDNSDHPDCTKKGSGTYVVYYCDTADGGKVKHFTVGSGEPVMQLKSPFPSLAEAKKVSVGSAKYAQKKLRGFSLSLPATPELMGMTAEGQLKLTGFGKVEDGDWKISQLSFRLNNQGLNINLELE
jgi:phage protein D